MGDDSEIKLPKAVLEFFKQTGAEGGASKSKAKTAASRKNGKLGGRPKKKDRHEKPSDAKPTRTARSLRK